MQPYDYAQQSLQSHHNAKNTFKSKNIIMEIIVTIEKINDTQEFASKKGDGKVYKKFSFVGKTSEQYPKRICFTCINEDLWQKFDLKIGAQYKVFFDVSSREWNGRWFTEVNCWRVMLLSGMQQASPVPNAQPYQPTQQPQQPAQNDDKNEQPPF